MESRQPIAHVKINHGTTDVDPRPLSFFFLPFIFSEFSRSSFFVSLLVCTWFVVVSLVVFFFLIAIPLTSLIPCVDGVAASFSLVIFCTILVFRHYSDALHECSSINLRTSERALWCFSAADLLRLSLLFSSCFSAESFQIQFSSASFYFVGQGYFLSFLRCSSVVFLWSSADLLAS